MKGKRATPGAKGSNQGRNKNGSMSHNVSQGKGKVKVDFAAINAACLDRYPNILQDWLPGGRTEGTEYVTSNTNGGSGHSLSVSLRDGIWKDFATGETGSDPVSLYAAINGLRQGEAARALRDRLGVNGAQRAPRKKKTAEGWTPVLPVPDSAPKPDFKHFQLGTPVATWTYHAPDCRTLGYVCRFQTPEGGKQTRPLTYCQDAHGNRAWRWKGFDALRPLYNAHFLEEFPDLPVVVCEGEKACDAAQTLLPGHVCVTWPNGSKSVNKADWSSLKERSVTVWPDADQAGHEAAEDIRRQLPQARIVTPPGDVAQGWDAADALAEGWTAERAVELVSMAVAPDKGDDFMAATVTAGDLLDSPLLPISWILNGSLPDRCVGAVVGSPGVGKSQLLLQLSAAVATGSGDFLADEWVPLAGKVLCCCAEDDARVVQRRLKAVMNAWFADGNIGLSRSEIESRLRENLIIRPATGEDLRLVGKGSDGAESTEIFDKLFQAAREIKDLRLIILDPKSRFFGGDENDQALNTFFVANLEKIAIKTGCSVLVCHHTVKNSGTVQGKFSINAALDQDAARGASALTGAVRWQLNVAALPENLAKQKFGKDARRGQYIAARISKKNYGAPEDTFYLERREHGVLHGAVPTHNRDVGHGALVAKVVETVEALTEQDRFMTEREFSRAFGAKWKPENASATQNGIRAAISLAVAEGKLRKLATKNGSGRPVEYLMVPDNLPQGKGGTQP